jgi:CheY-like chemotaxis protein
VGTEASIYLPRHHGAARAEGIPSDAQALPAAIAGETVLIVDDEPTVRVLVTDVLQDLGYRVIEAANGPAGLEVLHSGVQIDLLMTDVGLPGGMNGRQLADAARVTLPDLPVLFITGYAEQALFDDSQVEARMAVLTKPFAVAALASRIRELLRA